MTTDKRCVAPESLKECDDIECFECAFVYFRKDCFQPIDKNCYFRDFLANKESVQK